MVIGNDIHFCYLIQSYIRESTRLALITSWMDDALTLARREQPAAIVMEIDRPGTLGWNFLRELKSEVSTHAIPVVLCSWLDEQQRGLKEGAAACLRMPILYKDFISVLSEIGLYPCEQK